jgi:HEAT repeat protein
MLGPELHQSASAGARNVQECATDVREKRMTVRTALVGFLAFTLAQACLVAGQDKAASPVDLEQNSSQEQQKAPGAASQAPETEVPKQLPERPGSGAPAKPTLPPKQQAWSNLESAYKGNKVGDRATAIRVLGLLPNDGRARRVAEAGLSDEKPEVRAAASSALGDMGSRVSIPKLKTALDDKDPGVALAAAHALDLMHDEAAYEVYYEILSGERKSSKGLIASETSILKDKKKMAMLGFQEGIGFIPFAGIGWEAFRTITKDDSSPVRAAAAKVLAKDHDPATAKVLYDAADDKSWLVRAAAIEALAKRGDPAALDTVAAHMTDDKTAVRLTAAAAVVRLSSIQESSLRTKGKKEKTVPEKK